MSLRTDIRDFAAKAFYDSLVAGLGEQWTYANRGASVTLWVLPEHRGNSIMRQTINTRTQENSAQVSIPKQTNFPPTNGIAIDDKITDTSGNVYALRTFSNNDGVGAIYKMQFVQSLTKQAGAVGQ